jgi:hypothetical protein
LGRQGANIVAINKLHNEYAEALNDAGRLFENTPKAVLGAMVVSLMTCGGDTIDDTGALRERFLEEWAALHNCGIIPQKPIKAR